MALVSLDQLVVDASLQYAGTQVPFKKQKTRRILSRVG